MAISCYQAGLVNYLQVLIADNQYYQAKIGDLQALAQRCQDTLALFVALGGGWWNAEEKVQGNSQTLCVEVVMEEEKQIAKTTSRCSFLGVSLAIVLLAALAGVINTLVKYLRPTKEIIGAGATGGTTIVLLNEIPIGGSKTIRHLGKPYVVVRLTMGIYAVSAVCTHLGCIVSWDEVRKILVCPCHAAFFSLNGSVISGPPPAPLPASQVKVVGNQIIRLPRISRCLLPYDRPLCGNGGAPLRVLSRSRLQGGPSRLYPEIRYGRCYRFCR